MAQIILDKASRFYGVWEGRAVGVHEVSLEVADGEFLILLGPSGCGKSTTLRMIAGLEETTSGRILIGDRDVTRLSPRERNLAVVFQSYALYPTMTVADNIGFGLRMRGFPAAEIAARVDRVSRLLGLSDYLNRKPAALSGGQRQRVALGRAIVREPEAFLLDEPLSNLDAQLRGEMRGELVRLHQSLGNTIVHVTHDQTEAMTMGDRIAILRAGRLEQVGTPLDVYNNPANIFVARFLASPPMNFLRVRIDGEGEPRMWLSPEVSWPVPAAYVPAWAAHAGGEVMLGIRPEDLHVEAGERVGFDMQVEAVETLGHECIATGRICGAPEQPAIRTRLGKTFLPRVGETIRLHADMSAAHIFEPETELVIPRFSGGAKR